MPNRLSTAKGETIEMILPDGSLIVLNSASTLEYPISFSGLRERKVTLSGEAYMEIAKDKSHPFIIETRGQQVEVLGTKFNVNSYPDENAVVTTLEEGAVRLNSGSFSAVLKPGQQASSSGGQIHVTKVDPAKAIAWTKDEFVFDGDIPSIMRQISRWYSVEVVISSDVPEEEFYAVLSRKNKLGDILQYFELTGRVHFEVQGRRIMVKK
jgi:ferric-dicitrate binding protein FerR (iron transport regulator)